MGLRRRLSKKWNETVNGVLSGPGVDVDSVKTGNVSLDSVTGDGLPAHAIEHGKVWADNGELYNTVQAAEIAASSLVIIGSGTFQESVDVNTPDLTIVGLGRGTVIDGDTNNALTIDASGVSIERLAVQTTPGSGNFADGVQAAANEFAIKSIWVLQSDARGVRIGDADDGRVVSIYCDSANIDDEDISLAGPSSRNVVDDIIGTVFDSGTGNSVGETT